MTVHASFNNNNKNIGHHHYTDSAPAASKPNSLKPLPVILLHGIFSGTESMLMLKTFIDEALPGVTVYNIDAFNNLESTTYMWTQLDGIRTKMLKIFKDHPEGVNMICYSQGLNNHNILLCYQDFV